MRGVLAVAGLLAFGPIPAGADAPRVSVGFDGFAKNARWFPLAIEAVPGAELERIAIVRRDHRARDRVLAQFGGTRDARTGGWRALVRLEQSYGQQILQCTFTKADGTARAVEIPLHGLDRHDLLLLAVSDRPAEFQFLGTVERGVRRVTRCVAGGAGLLDGLSWQALDGVDAVVLDGPAPGREEDRQALHHWVAMGGTVILTGRALDGSAAWGLADPAPAAGPSVDRTASGEELAGLLAADPEAVRSARFRPPPAGFHPWVTGREGVIVGARAVGRGRVIAFGVDWTSMELEDRASFESVRRALWASLLDLRTPGAFRGMSADVAIPREAEVRTLLWPILGFLLICGLLLGPVNWRVAARRGRREAAVVSLPIGAALLALFVVGAGTFWRTRELVIVERSTAVTGPDGAAGYAGVFGVLAPARHTVDVSVADPFFRIEDLDALYRFSLEADPRLLRTTDAAGVRLEGVEIDRWAMRFFTARRPEAEAGLRAQAEAVSVNRLRGTVENRTARPVRHAMVYFGSDRVLLGDLPPHSATPFEMVLGEDAERRMGRCQGCGRYHIAVGPFADLEALEPHEDLLYSAHALFRTTTSPVALGLDTAPVPLLDVAGGTAAVRHDGVRLLAATVDMAWADPAVVPAGFAHQLRVPRRVAGDRYAASDPWEDLWEHVPFAFIPHALALRSALPATPGLTPDEDERTPPASRSPPMPAPVFLALPAPVAPSAAVHVLWDRGVPEPGEPPHVEAALEAFRWADGAWVELGRAATEAHRLPVGAGGAGFLLPGAPVLALRVRPVAPMAEDQILGLWQAVRSLDVTVGGGGPGDER